jgi:hypothetical protein
MLTRLIAVDVVCLQLVFIKPIRRGCYDQVMKTFFTPVQA